MITMNDTFYSKPTVLELSNSASEKLDFYKKEIGIRKAAIVNGLIEKYIQSYCEDLMKKINNVDV